MDRESPKTPVTVPDKSSPEGDCSHLAGDLPLCIAHRGFSARYPENTMPAFQAAVDAGADMIELDVAFTSGREIIVIHDDTLNRTTDGSGPVGKAPISAVRGLDAGSWFSREFAGTRVPELSEVLSALGGKIPINVEIKAGGKKRDTADLARDTATLVKEGGLTDSILFSSFSDKALAVVREVLPQARLGVLAKKRESPESALGRVEALEAESYHLKAGDLYPALVTRLHGKGVKVFVWTSAADNRQDIMEHALLAYADGFFANDPEIFLAVREKVCASNLP